MNKRKLLTLALTLCMIAILAIGGTLAYFTDSEKATNTMVIGNVKIDIDELTYDWDNNKWANFKDDEFTMYPQPAEDAQYNFNKVVYTANVSPSFDDAYIRNIVLFEANTIMGDVNKNEGNCCFPGMHIFHTSEDSKGSDGKAYLASKCTKLEDTVTINGKEYWVAVFEDDKNEAIPYNGSLASLTSVSMDKNVTSDQIAGWGADNKVDIIVFSQAIQTAELSYEEAMAALGEVNEANIFAWLGEANEYQENTWIKK